MEGCVEIQKVHSKRDFVSPQVLNRSFGASKEWRAFLDNWHVLERKMGYNVITRFEH